MRNLVIPLLTTVSLLPPIAAQNYTAHPIDNPTSSLSQNIPFAGGHVNWDEARSQFLLTAPYLPPAGALILGIELVPISTNTFHYERFELWLDHTQNTTLSPMFAANLTSPQLVFSRSPGTVTWTGGNWSSVQFDTPFVYDGVSNLVLECRKKIDRPSHGTISPSVSHRLFIYPSRTDLPAPIWDWGTYGSGVIDSGSARATTSQQMLIRLLVGGTPTLTIDSTRDTSTTSSRSYFHIGATLTTTVQGTPGSSAYHLFGVPLSQFPIPVASVQGELWLMPPLIVAYGQGAIDASGRHSASLPIPNDPALVGVHTYMQAVTVGSSVYFTNVVDALIDA